MQNLSTHKKSHAKTSLRAADFANLGWEMGYKGVKRMHSDKWPGQVAPDQAKLGCGPNGYVRSPSTTKPFLSDQRKCQLWHTVRLRKHGYRRLRENLVANEVGHFVGNVNVGNP